MKIYINIFIALIAVAANNGLVADVYAAAADRSHPHFRALTDVSTQNATESGNSTDSSSGTNNRAGAICENDSDCLSDMCIPGATSQECSRCCGQHPGGACNANGIGCNADYGGDCGGTNYPFTVAGDEIPGCYKCVYNDEEEMDIDTPSLRASILEDE
jgi:hypothetical protein